MDDIDRQLLEMLQDPTAQRVLSDMFAADQRFDLIRREIEIAFFPPLERHIADMLNKQKAPTD